MHFCSPYSDNKSFSLSKISRDARAHSEPVVFDDSPLGRVSSSSPRPAKRRKKRRALVRKNAEDSGRRLHALAHETRLTFSGEREKRRRRRRRGRERVFIQFLSDLLDERVQLCLSARFKVDSFFGKNFVWAPLALTFYFRDFSSFTFFLSRLQSQTRFQNFIIRDSPQVGRKKFFFFISAEKRSIFFLENLNELILPLTQTLKALSQAAHLKAINWIFINAAWACIIHCEKKGSLGRSSKPASRTVRKITARSNRP